MNKFSCDQIITVLKIEGYTVFENDTINYNLNIVGIRFNDNVNLFTDIKCVFWKFKGEWTYKEYLQTTKPGIYFLNHPENSRGCAILKEGQYRGCWQTGFHNGQHRALIQVKPITVFRDNNKDGTLDYNTPTDTGLFGINHHGTWNAPTYQKVDNWSAGCQVIASNTDQEEFMDICDQSVLNFGNSFSYTLLNIKDFGNIELAK